MNYLADLISRIRVAIIKRKTFVVIHNTKDCLKIVTKLFIDGYFLDMQVHGLEITLHFVFIDNKNVIRDIKLLSSPGFRRYLPAKLLRSKHNYHYEHYLFTNRGILNKREVLALGIGGEGILSIR